MRQLTRVLFVGMVLLAGCSRGPQMAEVEGVVKVKGQPTDGIQVEFWPEAEGPRSRGVSDSEGRFVLSTDEATKGAVVGKHRVVLTDVGILGTKILGRAGENVDMAEGKKPRISSDYSGASSPLTKDVVAGSKNEFEFDVEPGK